VRITAVSHTALGAVVVVASGVAAVTVGIAATRSDRDAAMRHCMAMARRGTMPARPTMAIQKRQTAVYNECMEQAGFGRGHAETK